MSEHTVDAKRLLCPMPVIRAQDSAEQLAKGDILKVICTDPGATNDIPAWCRINGHKVLDIITADNEITITIEVGGLG
jgi:tRNA 2-thiouridine synthesizing protein A